MINKFREDIRSLINNNFSGNDLLSVTLLMERYVKWNPNPLTKYQFEQNFKHFINLLNHKVYKNAYKRYGKHISLIPSLEYSERIGHHYHAIIKIPDGFSAWKFKEHINTCWVKTRYSRKDKHVHIQTMYSNGWSNYITKFNHLDDDIDWFNTHLNR
jgi:hypothetical protein